MSEGEFGLFAFDFFGDAKPGLNIAEVEDERILGDSLALASITELDADSSPHLGSAKLTVHNVTPGEVNNGGKIVPGVRVRVENGFTATLPYRLTVWVLNTRR